MTLSAQKRHSPARLPKNWLGRRGLLLLLAGATLTLGCGGEPPRAPNKMRPLDERRAVQLIATTMRDHGDGPAAGRMMALAEGLELEVDVSVAGHKFGVAYTNAQERSKIASVLPQVDSDSDALVLARGMGDEADARILVLKDDSYLYDDQVGTEHEETTITAENKLKRDVRDFLVRARAEKWP
ncbi:MAG: hypothetical protein H6718_13255 [Polyangiaceae bacterium]|nr:hypothetical protein [Polyangiaceae bacterium]MCB9607040.1 hypothetical protein [Polyangiaceae bacterium]